MYTIIQDKNDDEYTIVNFSKRAWSRAGWHLTTAELLNEFSEDFFKPEYGGNATSMKAFDSIEEYCITLQQHPDVISPVVITTFKDLDDLRDTNPEYFI